MKIKKWTGSAWQTLSPQVTYTDIVDDVTANSPSPIFDSGKLKATYLPDFVFGSMRFLDTASTGGYSAMADKFHAAYLLYGTDDINGLLGKYLIADSSFELASPASNQAQQKGAGTTANPTKYYLYNVNPDENEEHHPGGQDLTVESGDWIVFSKITGDGSSSTPYNIELSVVNNTYAYASSGQGGIVKLGYSQSGTTYPVQLNADKRAYVSVPWTDTNTRRSVSLAGTEKLTASSTTALNFVAGTNVTINESNGSFTIAATDTNTTYSQATSSTLGLVKIGYSENGKNYPVELDSGQMFVNVPWTDTNDNTQLSNEQVQDIVGGMFSGNTETNINVAYQDGDGTIDLSVDDGVGLTGTANGLKMTYPIAVDNSGTGPDANSGFRITNGALWFDLS